MMYTVKSRVLSHRNISWKCCSWQGASAQVEEPTDAQIKSFHFKITKITTLAQLSFLLTPLLRELDNNLDTQKFKSLGVQVDHYQWILQINNMLIWAVISRGFALWSVMLTWWPHRPAFKIWAWLASHIGELPFEGLWLVFSVVGGCYFFAGRYCTEPVLCNKGLYAQNGFVQ